MARVLRGTRYHDPKDKISDQLATRILDRLPYYDYEETKDFYRKFADRLRLKDRALLGCNDRFFLLTVLMGRSDLSHQWLFSRCREVEAAPDGHIDLWARGHGKLLRVDEPIPTPSGWAKHGDLEPGDELFGPDGKVCRVIARTEVLERPAECLITFDDGTEMVAGDNHLWTVERHTRKRIPMAYKTSGPQRLYRESVTISTAEIAAHDHRTDNRLAVRVNDPIKLPVADLLIDPYVLGVWLGDGTATQATVTAGLTDADEMQNLLAATGIQVRRRSHSNAVTLVLGSGVRWKKGSSEFRNALRAFGILGRKAIPPVYLRASISQRLALLQGLMDTDGDCDKRSTATFSNTNEAIIDGFCELANSLGLKPHRRVKTIKVNSKPYRFWQVSFQAYKAVPPFRLARKFARCKDGARPNPRRYIVSCERIEPTPGSCIQVDRPDGLYLAGRAMVTTHNSSIITTGGTIQEIMCDPEITIAIFSVIKPTAVEFLAQIKTEFENNEHLKDVYPDVLYRNPRGRGPDGKPSKWGTQRGITVKRTGRPKEATVEAHGLIDGQPTGRHFKMHIYDDVVTQDNLTDEQLKKTSLRFEMADNLGTRHGVRKWIAGTRYHFADAYGQIIDKGSAIPRIYPATEDGTLNGKLVLLTPENWERIKRDQSKVVSAQMLLNPLAGTEATFRSTWLRTYDVIPAIMNVYILCDPSKGTGERSDRTAIAVIGIDPAGNKFLLDGYRHRMKLSDRYERIKQLKFKWERHAGVQMVRVGYERYGQQVDLEVIEDIQQRENIHFELEELNTPRQGGHSKDDRIERLEPDIRDGRFYLPCVAHHPDFGEHDGSCYWSVWGEEEAKRAKAQDIKVEYHLGQIIYRPMKGLTRRQRECEDKGQKYRIVTALKRRDENNDLYDLTRAFIEEAVRHPFAPHDDLIDAVSRIYDIDPLAPTMYEARSVEPLGLDAEERMMTEEEVINYGDTGGSMGRTI